MAKPDYSDPRFDHCFDLRYVGQGHGDHGGSSVLMWDSTSDGLRQTYTLEMPGMAYPVCGYCGNRALPIQSSGSSLITSYRLVGYTCCCTGAADEIDHRKQVEDLKERQYAEMQALKARAPKPSAEVLQKALQDYAQSLAMSFAGASPKAINKLSARLQEACRFNHWS